MATIAPTSMRDATTTDYLAGVPIVLHTLYPTSMFEPPNPNPPPTEGLLWPRFDYIVDDEA